MPRSRLFNLAWPMVLTFALFFLVDFSIKPVLLAADQTKTANVSQKEETWQRVIVYWNDPQAVAFPDLPAGGDIAAHRQQIVDYLQQNAEIQRLAAEPHVTALERAGHVKNVRHLWLPNAMAAEVTAEGIEALAAAPEVKTILEDALIDTFIPDDLPDILGLQMVTETSEAGNSGLGLIDVPEVWHGLGVTGTGATVAIIDSGVDWLHPDLTANYRGRLPGGGVDHASSWYHAAHPTITTPVDEFWHGTHVAGTAIGDANLGVAPGASWIGVSISDHDGQIFNSYIYAAFEWILAPGGRPDLAPDVVNGSWGASGAFTFFIDEIDLLRQAGIVPVFAAGNAGPYPKSIGTPAGYTNTLAIGASDDEGEVAWFSSRGPSSLSPEIKPDVVAPGVNILSTMPEGQYGRANGTSMASPHVAGVVALLRSADPTLSVKEIEDLLRSTARPVNSSTPNMRSGWGLVDAYAAVADQIPSGILEVTLRDGGIPLPGFGVTVTTPAGVQLFFTTDSAGRISAPLAPGIYQVDVTIFGYRSQTVSGLAVGVDQTTVTNLDLLRQPGALIQGQLLLNGQPAAGHVDLIATGETVSTDSGGQFSRYLPAGSHEIRFRAAGGRVVRRSITVEAGPPLQISQNLPLGPNVLVVDGGRWHFTSVIPWYQTALWDAGYEVDIWQIVDPLADVPALDLLQQYDAVFWGDPRFSPAALGAGLVISQYLDSGGNLFVSGQNVAEYEASFIGFPWNETHLNGRWDGNTVISTGIAGVDGTLFADIDLSLNGGDSLANQDSLDRWEILPFSLAEAVFTNESGDILGVQNGRCRPFQAIGLGIGLEGVSDSADRQAIAATAMEYFATETADRGVRWFSEPIERIVSPGQTITFELGMQNLSELITDTLAVQLNGNSWPAEIVTDSLTLGPCESGLSQLIVKVPAAASKNESSTFILSVSSQEFSGESDHLPVSLKTPDQILLVNDYRWFNPLPAYGAMLDGLNQGYDVWHTDPQHGGWGSPPADLLSNYDRVIWVTSYDWFRPVTAHESEVLEAYLEGGGRLLLTSQDFMYYHRQDTLTRHYLGVISYHESITPTQILLHEGPLWSTPVANGQPLTFPDYLNNGDALILAENADILAWNHHGIAAAGRRGTGSSGNPWRTIFMAFPLERTPEAFHRPFMQAALGWLTDWGDSNLHFEKRVVTAGETVTVHLDLDGGTTSETLTVTLPRTDNVTPVMETLPSGSTSSSNGDIILWVGQGKDARPFSFSVSVDHGAAPGSAITLSVGLDNGEIQWPLESRAIVDGPDFAGSGVSLALIEEINGVYHIQGDLILRNTGVRPATGVSAVVAFSDGLFPLTDTVSGASGSAEFANSRLIWNGDLAAGQTITTGVRFTTARPYYSFWATGTATVYSDQREPAVLFNQLKLPAYEIIIPLVYKP